VRTTINIEDDVLQAAKELARREGSTTGRMLSALARRGLNSGGRPAKGSRGGRVRGGVPVVPSRGEVITIEKTRILANEEGI